MKGASEEKRDVTVVEAILQLKAILEDIEQRLSAIEDRLEQEDAHQREREREPRD